MPCPSVETGRQNRLKPCWRQRRAGSIPASDIYIALWRNWQTRQIQTLFLCGFDFHRGYSAIMANGSCVMKMTGRVGVGIERPTGSAAEGKKTVTRN